MHLGYIECKAVVAKMMKPILIVILFVSAGLAGCLASEEESSTSVEAIFSFDPDKNIRTDMDIDFDAGASLPVGASLTYKWTLITTVLTMKQAELQLGHTSSGNYEVKLTVSDGTSSSSH